MFKYDPAFSSPPTPTPTPTATPSNQCAPVTFTDDGAKHITMATTTAGATIFYTNDGTSPTHSGGTATGTTHTYTTTITVPNCVDSPFSALAYKAGMTDSVVTSYDADYTNGTRCGGGAMMMGGMMDLPAMVTTTTFSVWDGDWAILEEYTFDGTTSSLSQSYVQGYHGLVKTLVDNIYYYQDELGSTSHIADVRGALLEYYKYDLYGKPTYWSALNTQLSTTNYGVAVLGNGGGRYMAELGLYDFRNRFMSPDLGRFLQPDPIGFKGDTSNLYRYCGNDWANRADELGLDFSDPYGDFDRAHPGATTRFNMQKTIVDGKISRFGKTLITSRTIRVEAEGSKLVLKTYNVGVSQRFIAEEKPAPGMGRSTEPRASSEIAATKEHEDKHVSQLRALHDQYQKKLGTAVGHVEPGQSSTTAVNAKQQELVDEQNRLFMSHEPKSEWGGILREEGRSPRQVSEMYKAEAVAPGTAYSSGDSGGSSSADSVEPDMTDLTNDSCPSFPHLTAPAK